MYSKCYANLADIASTYDAFRVPIGTKWRVFCRLDRNTYIMVRHLLDSIKFFPLLIYSFPLLAPHHLYESEKFNILYLDPSEITEISDKLRYYRYRKALLQREVAYLLDIDRTTYSTYEEGNKDYYPIEHMQKLAALYEIPVTELLDDYNMFLYLDHGKQIREKRNKLGLTRKQYADLIGVHAGTLKRWELNTVNIFKSTWEKYFK